MQGDDYFKWDLECLERADKRGMAKRFRDRDSSLKEDLSKAEAILVKVFNDPFTSKSLLLEVNEFLSYLHHKDKGTLWDE